MPIVCSENNEDPGILLSPVTHLQGVCYVAWGTQALACNACAPGHSIANM